MGGRHGVVITPHACHARACRAGVIWEGGMVWWLRYMPFLLCIDRLEQKFEKTKQNRPNQ